MASNDKSERDRFFVDERVGCIAVRDREKTDPDYQGLHPDTAGVIRYWHGFAKVKTCPTCGGTQGDGFVLNIEAIKEANEFCDELNRRNQ